MPSVLKTRLSDLAEAHRIWMRMFTIRMVRLRATSQPLIFENSLLSTYINPSALQKIRHGDNAFIQHRVCWKTGILCCLFVATTPFQWRTDGNCRHPILSIWNFFGESSDQYFSQHPQHLHGRSSLRCLILSYFVSQWLTFPLKFITQTLRRTSLTKVNQPLVWKADDEIGLMVREYNQMLFKLSESKAELEQTQRERAWREIAQQVAHEIKNPLTPMKLTLQQMERALQSGKNTEEKTGKAIGTLLTQVDTLNEIASSFSSFAKMPEPVIQK